MATATIKIKRKISSPHLRISELKDFIGKYVEITVRESASENKIPSDKPAAGILSDFKNKEKVAMEKKAWKIAVNEKHGNN
jgi:hypothetical protein